ncbi:hypothetical protein QJQ45_007474 [Haematococcus lacustris]|nr:hypothetical protein QJQ45_007474 [Haematococcus lacustris]
MAARSWSMLDLPDELLRTVVLYSDQEERRALAATCIRLWNDRLHFASEFFLDLEPRTGGGPPPISARLIRALQTTTTTLQLTLGLKPDLVSHAEDCMLVTDVLEALKPCPTVEHFSLLGDADTDRKPVHHLFWTPCHTQQLLRAFPGLTSLSLLHRVISIYMLGGPAGLLSHPDLCQQLQHLTLCNVMLEEPAQEHPAAVTLDTLFQGCRLQSLELTNMEQLPSLQPLAEHLTDLYLENTLFDNLPSLHLVCDTLSGLTRLCSLTLSYEASSECSMDGFPQLMQALPSLVSLSVPNLVVKGVAELDTLLAATQLTRLVLEGVKRVAESRAQAACGWQRLKLMVGSVGFDTMAAACLPLHSLTSSLVLGGMTLARGVPQCVHNLRQRCTVYVDLDSLSVDMAGTALLPLTPAEEQQALDQAAAVVAANTPPGAEELLTVAQRLFQLREVSREGMVLRNIPRITADTAKALAPISPGVTNLHFFRGEVAADLQLFLGLLEGMPDLERVMFNWVSFDVLAMEGVMQQLGSTPGSRPLMICFSVSQELFNSDAACCERMCTYTEGSSVFVHVRASPYEPPAAVGEV